MKNYKFAYALLLPALVFMMDACAKRDSGFDKAGAQKKAQAAADKAKAGPTQQQQQPAKGSGSAATTSPTTKTDDKAAKQADSTSSGQDGSQVYSDTCDNPVSMDVKSDEKEIKLEELVAGDKGAYQLMSTVYFTEKQLKGSDKKESVHAEGSTFATPDKMTTTVRDQSKITVVCHNIKAVQGGTEEIKGGLGFPNDISSVDGKINVVRNDQVDIKNGEIFVISSLVAQASDLKQVASKWTDAKVVVTKSTDKDGNVTAVVKTQKQGTDSAGNKRSTWVAATYQFKKQQ